MFLNLDKQRYTDTIVVEKKSHYWPGMLPGLSGGDNYLGINYHSAGTSPEARSPRSPVSPGQCRCRRCSFLPLEECEPKEVSALFKFLRKSKVGNQRSYLFSYLCCITIHTNHARSRPFQMIVMIADDKASGQILVFSLFIIKRQAKPVFWFWLGKFQGLFYLAPLKWS